MDTNDLAELEDLLLRRFEEMVKKILEPVAKRADLAPLISLIRRREELAEALANRVVSLLDRLVKVTEAFDSVRRELRELVMSKDAERAELRHVLTVINERLAVISKDVDDSVREITGAFKISTPSTAAPAGALDVSDTARMVGRVVLWAWRSKPVMLAVTALGSGGIGATLYHYIHVWFTR